MHIRFQTNAAIVAVCAVIVVGGILLWRGAISVHDTKYPLTVVNPPRLKVAASLPFLSAMVTWVCGGNCVVETITPESDKEVLLGAAIIFYTGEGSDPHMNSFFVLAPSVPVLSLSQLEPEKKPYFWFSPLSAMRIVHTISRQLAGYDPVRKESFIDNAYELSSQISQIQKEADDIIRGFRTVRALVLEPGLENFLSSARVSSVPGWEGGINGDNAAARMKTAQAQIIVAGPRSSFMVADFPESLKKRTLVLDPFGEEWGLYDIFDILGRNYARLFSLLDKFAR